MSEIDPKLAKKYATDLRMIATYHGIEGYISGMILNAAADMLEQFVHAKSQAEAERARGAKLVADVNETLNFIDTVGLTSGPLVPVFNTLKSALAAYEGS